MEAVEALIDTALEHEILTNKNPYLTKETLVLRLYEKIFYHTRVAYTAPCEKTICFSYWHEEIFTTYESLKYKMSHDEKVYVERVLSKDSPHINELTKFANCWYKYNPTLTCKWFAVDGILGHHPKAYVYDAFSKTFFNHNNAVRSLYAYYSDPEKIKEIVEHAFLIEENEDIVSDLDPDIKRCIGLYAEIVGSDEIKLVAVDRRARLQSQQQNQPNKRRKSKKFEPHSPQNLE